MKSFILQAIIYVIFVSFYSCSNDDDNVQSSVEINSEYVKGQVSGDLNYNWNATNGSNDSTSVFYYEELQYLVSIRSNEGQHRTMSISLLPYYGSGKYVFRGDNGITLRLGRDEDFRYTTSQDSSRNPYYKGGGELYLEELNNGFKGTFNAIAFNHKGDSISIKNGSFSVKYPYTNPACSSKDYIGPLSNDINEDYCRWMNYTLCAENDFLAIGYCITVFNNPDSNTTIPYCPYCDSL